MPNRTRYRFTNIDAFQQGTSPDSAIELPDRVPRRDSFIWNPTGGGGVIRADILGVSDDYLTALPVGSSESVLVAMPTALRRSNYDGATINGWSYTYLSPGLRKIANNLANGIERVWPWWYGAYPIYIASASTGIVVGSDEIQFIDVNVDALHWDMDKNAFEICLPGNQTGLGLFDGSVSSP